MKKYLAILFAVLALLLAACAGRQKAPANYNVIIASDLHYISPRITDNGEYFMRVLANGDGKLSQYSEEITDAFLAEVVAQKPEALILTGDLTFNGAMESHEDLAEKLRAVEAAGVPVLVLTGNHDVYNGNAARYEGDHFEHVPSAATLGFHQVYGAFGPDEALALDESSLSYVYQLNETTRALMLDFNTLGSPCGLSEDTLSWVERQLKQAKADGQTVLAAGHQNLFQHSMFTYGYVINGAEALSGLLERYGVELFFSGHMHIQHYLQQGKVTEICTSALCLSPCQYAVLTAENGKISYDTRPVDVSAWAKGRGSEDENLLNFTAYAAAAFDQRGEVQAREALEDADLSPEEKEAMISYACAIQRGVFSGDLRAAGEIDPDGSLAALWSRVGNLHGYYLSTITPEVGMDYNHWSN